GPGYRLHFVRPLRPPPAVRLGRTDRPPGAAARLPAARLPRRGVRRGARAGAPRRGPEGRIVTAGRKKSAGRPIFLDKPERRVMMGRRGEWPCGRLFSL